MSLTSRMLRYAAHHHLWPPSRLVAAVSGGSDSVCMLLLLHDLHARGDVQVTVAHLNHQIRPEADRDEAFCRDLAGRLGLSFVATRVDVPALARAKRQSIELTGRMARREFLDRVRQSSGSDRIATAHSADDQAETVLMRVMRGAGMRGLAGIAPRQGARVRPLLWARRSELREELVARGETWREDSTNADLRHPRNRIRHELLPYLERQFNPAVREALVRLADAARADDALLARLAAAAGAGMTERQPDSTTIDSDTLLALPPALNRRVVIAALAALTDRTPSHDDVARVLEVAATTGAAGDLSVGRVEHFGGKVVLVLRRGGLPPAPQPREPFCLELSVPGTIPTPGGWVVEAHGYDRPQRRDPQPDVAQIDAAAVGGGLLVRRRRPGDRLRPVGLGGSKKVQDVLVDRKVARRDRDAVPIVTDKQGRIVWVAGHALGEEFRVTEGTKSVIILKLRRI